MVYKYSWSGPQRSVSAEKVAKHISGLEKSYGEVTPQRFLDSARSEESEMHSLFEWDDTKAAEQYRLSQARTIMGSIRVKVIEEEVETRVTRAFVQPEVRKGGYVSIVNALSDTDKKAKVLEQARTELK